MKKIILFIISFSSMFSYADVVVNNSPLTDLEPIKSFTGIFESSTLNVTTEIDKECAYRVRYNDREKALIIEGVAHPITRFSCLSPKLNDIYTCEGRICTSVTNPSGLQGKAYILSNDNIRLSYTKSTRYKIVLRKISQTTLEPIYFKTKAAKPFSISVNANLRDYNTLFFQAQRELSYVIEELKDQAEQMALVRCHEYYRFCTISLSKLKKGSASFSRTRGAFSGRITRIDSFPEWIAIASPDDPHLSK